MTTATADPHPAMTLAPVAQGERIAALDVARGVALLGILLVNMAFFSEPFGDLMRPNAAAEMAAPDRAVFYFTRVFCEGKFYTLFSTLFGIGLAMQWTRAHAAGRSFKGPGLRRLFFLMAVALAHVLLFWYGDILFSYAVLGLVLLPMLRWRARTLVAIGCATIGFASVLGAGFMAMQSLGAQRVQQAKDAATAAEGAPSAAPDGKAEPKVDAEPAVPAASGEQTGTPPAATTAEPAEPEKPEAPQWLDQAQGPFWELIRGFRDGKITQGPTDPRWSGNEALAYRNGPWSQQFLFRVFTWMIFLVVMAINFGWSVLGMFCLGAALLKGGALGADRVALHRRFAFVLLPLGLVGAVASVALMTYFKSPWARALSAFIGLPSSSCVALGYLGVVLLWVRSGSAGSLARWIGATGRMGFTNYLMQTVVCTTIFYHYGLGLFDQTTPSQRMAMALVLYATQVVVSNLWMKQFQFGPLEWVWRCVTYWRRQPMLRDAAGGIPVAS